MITSYPLLTKCLREVCAEFNLPPGVVFNDDLFPDKRLKVLKKYNESLSRRP